MLSKVEPINPDFEQRQQNHENFHFCFSLRKWNYFSRNVEIQKQNVKNSRRSCEQYLSSLKVFCMHKSRHHLPPLHPYLFPFHLRLDVVNSTVVIVIEYITAKALKLICYVMIMPSTRLRKRIRRVECSLSWYRA